MCSLLYTFISFERKKDSQGGSQVGSQGGSLSARSFDLARPGLAPPLSTNQANSAFHPLGVDK